MNFWKSKNIPHKGWECISVEDTTDDSFPVDERKYSTCEMCGNEKIRYVHHMQHSNYDDILGVGCICAGRMEENYIASTLREKEFKKSQKSIKKLLKKWKISKNGNYYLKINDICLVVYKQKNLWGGVFKNIDKTIFGKKRFESANNVKKILIDYCIKRGII